jgi:ATP-dependent RNA helicase RhlE
VEKLVSSLQRKNMNVAGMSSDYEQSERQRILQQFKSRQTRIVVATDVLSRGIDIKDIDLVINYDVPNDAEDYVHRVGRTARAATKGLAITFISGEEIYKFRRIEQFVEREYEKLNPPESLGEAPRWDEPQSKERRGGFNRKPRPKKASSGQASHSGKRPFRPKGKGQGANKDNNAGPKPQ